MPWRGRSFVQYPAPMDTALCGVTSSATSASWASAGCHAPASAAQSAVVLKVRCVVLMIVSLGPSAAEASGGRAVLRAVASVDVGVAVEAAPRHAAEQRGAL